MATIGRQLTNEMALGAAWLSANGQGATDCWIEVPGKQRACKLLSCEEEDGTRVHLAHFVGSEMRRAVVATARVQVSEGTAKRLQAAYKRSQETAEEKAAREAAASENALNVQLWLSYQAKQKRRNSSGQYIGHSCEPAGRR